MGMQERGRIGQQCWIWRKGRKRGKGRKDEKNIAIGEKKSAVKTDDFPINDMMSNIKNTMPNTTIMAHMDIIVDF